MDSPLEETKEEKKGENLEILEKKMDKTDEKKKDGQNGRKEKDRKKG